VAQRKIIWTQTAGNQLRSLLEFWTTNNESNRYALKLLDLVEENLSGIAIRPERSPESVFPNTRVAAMNHYSIYYEFSDQLIVVTAFWDNRQDPQKLYRLLNK